MFEVSWQPGMGDGLYVHGAPGEDQDTGHSEGLVSGPLRGVRGLDVEQDFTHMFSSSGDTSWGPVVAPPVDRDAIVKQTVHGALISANGGHWFPYVETPHWATLQTNTELVARAQYAEAAEEWYNSAEGREVMEAVPSGHTRLAEWSEEYEDERSRCIP